MAPPPPNPLDSVLRRLYHRNLHVIKLGLDVERALLAELGNPQNAFLSIHVAGTNGKGSTCAILDSILRAAGYRVGLYTSPHLRRFGERIRVQGEAIPDEALSALLDEVETAAARVRAQGRRDATFFEFTTAAALAHFRNRGVQIAVLETGMGGRLDATNVVEPAVCLITSIGLDHEAYLGRSIEAIAREKAGIIKPGRPVVLGELPPPAAAVMTDTARANASEPVRAAERCAVSRISQDWRGQELRVELDGAAPGVLRCPLLGRHQLGNVAMALAGLQVFSRETGLPVSAQALRTGLAAVQWPARAQVLRRDPPVLVDGAHNPDAMSALRRTVDELRGPMPVGLVASFLADKDAAGCLRAMAPAVRRCWLVPRTGERAMDAASLRVAAGQAGLEAACADLAVALREAEEWARADGGMVVVAGSLYLAGELLDQVGFPV